MVVKLQHSLCPLQVLFAFQVESITTKHLSIMSSTTSTPFRKPILKDVWLHPILYFVRNVAFGIQLVLWKTNTVWTQDVFFNYGDLERCPAVRFLGVLWIQSGLSAPLPCLVQQWLVRKASDPVPFLRLLNIFHFNCKGIHSFSSPNPKTPVTQSSLPFFDLNLQLIKDGKTNKKRKNGKENLWWSDVFPKGDGWLVSEVRSTLRIQIKAVDASRRTPCI